MNPIESAPEALRISASRRETSASASSQLDGTSFPSRRTSGSFRRSGCLVKSNPKRPFTHRKSLLKPERSRLLARRISLLRTLSVVLHPFEQCVHTVETYVISQGRVLYRYVPLVRAPTGQISMHMPHSSQSRWSSPLGIITDCEPRWPTPSALTSMPSSHTRTQRKHRMQRGAS